MTRINLKNPIALAISLTLLNSCSNDTDIPDASGVFEATEIIISAEASGKIMTLSLEDGDLLKSGQIIGVIDSTQLYLQKEQMLANKAAILAGRPDIPAQIASTECQIKYQEQELLRIEKLKAGDAATQKQLDDIQSMLEVLKATLTAQKSSLNTSVNAIYAQSRTIDVQILQINDQLKKCVIKCPISGTVLVKYANENEMTGMGKPLFKMADLSEIILRAYITGDQLANVKLNQKVNVRTDDGQGGYKTTEGIITWINDQAEFTPKTIQTKDERANKVYAIKIKVKNDGLYKIGMYGEVKL